MKEISLPIEIRTAEKKKVNRLRKNGYVPGVYYLHGEPSTNLQIKLNELMAIISTTETHILNLNFIPVDVRQGIIRDIQFDPVTDKPIHIDFQGVRADEKLTIKVPVVLSGGTPIGVREGGILQHILHSIEVFCLPKYIPEHIEINVADLKINHSIHVSDIKIENVDFLTHKEDAIVSVLPPLVEKTPTPEEEAAQKTE